MRRICVFAGSSPGRREEYAAAARALGDELAARGIEVIYGGSSVGLLGEAAHAAPAAGRLAPGGFSGRPRPCGAARLRTVSLFWPKGGPAVCRRVRSRLLCRELGGGAPRRAGGWGSRPRRAGGWGSRPRPEGQG